METFNAGTLTILGFILAIGAGGWALNQQQRADMAAMRVELRGDIDRVSIEVNTLALKVSRIEGLLEGSRVAGDIPK